MIFLSDIETVLRIPASDVLSGCAYIEIDWRRTSSRLNDIGHGPKVYQYGNYWVPYGMEAYLRNLMFAKMWSVLEVVGAIYRMYDSEGNQLGSAVNLNGSDFDVLYVERPIKTSLSADDFVESVMLHSDKIGWITPDLRFWYHYAGVYGISGNSVTFTHRDGSTEEVNPPSELRFDEDIVSAHIQLRNRSMDVVYLNQEATIFYFRNIFNRDEEISIPGAITQSPSSDYEEGAAGAYQGKYNISHEIEYTLKASSLPAFMYRTIMAMCRSKYVRLGHMGPQIIISSYKFGRSSGPNKPISLELKYRYADTQKDVTMAMS